MPVRSWGRSHVSFFVLLFGVLLAALPHEVYAAGLSLSPAAGSVSVGQTLSLQIMIDPGSDKVNASDGTIKFDTTALSVSSISKDGSLFSLWTADPTFSNTDGTISFSGGTPTAFSTKGKVLTIIFKGKAIGSAEVTFDKGSVLAADGKGTDVYTKGLGATITVTAAKAAPPPTPTPTPVNTSADTQSADASSASGDPPIAPIITSSSFPKLDSWYATSTGVFLWAITPDITGVRTLLSTKDNDIPKISLKGGATSTQKVFDIKEGVSYFYVQLKNDSGWGDVGKLKFQVDTTPPTAFNVAVQEPGSEGGLAKLAFKTDDLLSGMDHYELMIGTSTPISINIKDITDGTYPVPPQPGGIQHVVVRAYDKAGNFTVATHDLTLPAIAKPKSAAAAEETPAPVASSGFGMQGILLVLLALISGGLIVLNRFTRKTTQREKEKLLQAVLEVRDKNDRIFSAMREEFEQLINNFDAKPQLTPEERDLLESIKEVLDISEELVDTSIEDLKKLVRNQP